MKTITYFEIFTFSLFFGVFVIRSIILQARGIQVFAISKGKSLKEKILESLFMPVFFGWAILLGIIVFNSKGHNLPDWISGSLFNSVFTDVIAILLLTGSLILFVGAIISFGNSWRIGIDDKAPGTLIERGIFSISRNPIFLSIDLYFIGAALLHSSWLFIPLAILTPIGIHMQIKNEEKFLSSFYGKSYANYRKNTPRYIIF